MNHAKGRELEVCLNEADSHKSQEHVLIAALETNSCCGTIHPPELE